jgi:hypothetical protein
LPEDSPRIVAGIYHELIEIKAMASRTEEGMNSLRESMLGHGGHIHRQEKHIRNLYAAVDSLKASRARLAGGWKAAVIGGSILVGAAEAMHAAANALSLFRGH